MKTLPFISEDTFPYDMSEIKALESIRNGEVSRRVVVLGLAALAVTVIYDTRLFLGWFVAYLGYVALFQYALMRTPDRANAGQFAVILGFGVIDAVIYSAVVVLAWMQEPVVFKYVGLVAIHAAMMNCVSQRATEPLLAVTNATVLGIVCLTLPFLDLYLYGNRENYIVLMIILYTSATYFAISLNQSIQAHRMRKLSVMREADRIKLESLGQLTGGVAHDFNNLLTVILGNMDLRRELENEEDREELLTEVEVAARKAAQLTNQLLVYSRRSALEPELTGLEPPLRRAESLLTRLLPASVRLAIDLPPGLPQIEVDVGKFEIVVVNLVLNGRDAMPSGGVIRISARISTPEDRRRSGQEVELEDRAYLALTVVDQGMGIPKDMLARVLEPYFTTKAVGKGSGLGLPMALGFAEQSGGALSIDSVEGQGTDVTLWFPIPPAELRNLAVDGMRGGISLSPAARQ